MNEKLIFTPAVCLCIFFCLLSGCSEPPGGNILVKEGPKKVGASTSVGAIDLSSQNTDKYNINDKKIQRKRNENSIIGMWSTVIGPDRNGGHLYVTWDFQSNGVWKGGVYADLANSTNTFSTKWRLDGNNLYDTGGDEDFLYVIKWLGDEKFKVMQTKGMVANAVFERNYQGKFEGKTDKKITQNSMVCPRCNGSGYHACSLPPLSAEDIKCRTNQEFANCMTTNNADKTQVTCCRCNGTGIWRH